MARLADRFDLIAPDLRGFGDSPKPARGRSDPTCTRRTCGRCSIIWASAKSASSATMSAAHVAQSFAHAHAQRLTRLFFFDCPYPWNQEPDRRNRRRTGRPMRSCASRASGCINAPPTSVTDDASLREAKRIHQYQHVGGLGFGSEQPLGLVAVAEASRSGAISMKVGEPGITGSQVSQNSGQPCSNSSGRPAPMRTT